MVSGCWANEPFQWLITSLIGVMELCTKGLGGSVLNLKQRGVNLSCVRTCVVVAEERPRIALTQSFTKLFSGLSLSPRAVSTSFGCRVNTGICLQVWKHLTLSWVAFTTFCLFSTGRKFARSNHCLCWPSSFEKRQGDVDRTRSASFLGTDGVWKTPSRSQCHHR